MVNVVLVITSFVFAGLLAAAAFYFLVYFQHPADKNVAWLPKVVVISGLSLATYNIFLLPLDVANENEPDSSSISLTVMAYLTIALYSLTIIMAFIVFPFTKFWYEGIDEDDDPQAKSGIIVNPLVYVVAMFSFIGTIIFVLFGGIGLVSLPFDLIEVFVKRPKPMTSAEYEAKKTIIGEHAAILHETGQLIMEELKGKREAAHNRAARNLRRRENDFRRDVLILEVSLMSSKLTDLQLSVLLSISWVVHMCLWTIPLLFTFDGAGIYPFLNNMFIAMGSIPFLGVAFYAMFSFYLLACVVSGIIKVGMKLFFISIHPMEIGATFMDSMIFNTGVILTSSLAVAQYCTISFSTYAQYTASQSIFGVQTRNLQGLKQGYMALYVIFPAVALINLVYICYSPYRKQKSGKMKLYNI
ncbi:MAG: hypothetical protein SGCHY_001290 [Lobulomycetales sp.]